MSIDPSTAVPAAPPLEAATAIPVSRIVGDHPIPRGPAREEDLGFRRRSMVQWFAPGELAATGLRAVLSSVFGAYADRREVQAALHQHHEGPAGSATAHRDGVHRYDADPRARTQDGFWIDYVADLGDGFDSTYTVAWLLAQPSLPAPAAGEEAEVPAAGPERAIPAGHTRRGRVLVMGGDQVYPTASAEEYNDRMSGPYGAALPWETDPPHLFAIPGNHDWYDGLTAFIRLFCQDRWIGGWKTRQARSYWALKLPRGWWALGIDVQLASDLDQPQMDYFCKVAAEMRPGDRVILCTAEPAWVHTLADPKAFDNLRLFEEKVLVPAGAELALTLTGDLHHYSRYTDEGPEGKARRHKITAGGGGAYLLGTQLLPEELSLEKARNKGQKKSGVRFEEAPSERWLRGPLYPDCMRSMGIKLGGVFRLFYKNPTFTVFMGFVYLVAAWFLQSASLTSANFEGSFLDQASEQAMAVNPAGIWTALKEAWDVAIHAPSVLMFGLLFVFGMIAFCAPDVQRSHLLVKYPRLRGLMRGVVGGVHGVMHAVLAVTLTWAFGRFNLGTLGMNGDSWQQVALFSVEMFALGGIAAALLMSAFLIPFVNYNEAFSAQHLETYKNFVRMRIDPESGELTVYSYGVDDPASWRFHPDAEPGAPYYDPTAAPRVRLIDGPLTLAAPVSAAPAPEGK